VTSGGESFQGCNKLALSISSRRSDGQAKLLKTPFSMHLNRVLLIER
jgi:hypothetical protein